MEKKTDLKQLKSVAHALLMTDIHPTEFSPAIVKHPFTDSGIVALNTDGEIKLLDITKDANHLNLWHSFLSNQIDNAKTAFQIYMMTTKPYGLTFLKFANPYLSKEDFSSILNDAWIKSENPNQDVNLSKSKLLAMFKSADPIILMDENDYRIFQTLDDSVTVYRGVTSYNADNVKALSWTLNQETAEWFAHRFGEEGTVYEAHIPKKHIYAFFNSRGESEVIVDPKYLTDITEAQEMDEYIEQQQEMRIGEM